MKHPELTKGSLPEDYVVLFRRLDEQLKSSATAFDAAPYVSMIFEQLANGVRPNQLFAWQPPETHGGLDPYFTALLDAYLDYLVHTDIETSIATSDVQIVNQLFQDILDGGEPDRVLAFEVVSEAPGPEKSRSRQVVYAFMVIRELASMVPSSVSGKADPRCLENALDRVAGACDVDRSVVEEAYADKEIYREARKLIDLQSGITPEMQEAAARESGTGNDPSDNELARDYAKDWWARARRDK